MAPRNGRGSRLTRTGLAASTTGFTSPGLVVDDPADAPVDAGQRFVGMQRVRWRQVGLSRRAGLPGSVHQRASVAAVADQHLAHVGFRAHETETVARLGEPRQADAVGRQGRAVPRVDDPLAGLGRQLSGFREAPWGAPCGEQACCLCVLNRLIRKATRRTPQKWLNPLWAVLRRTTDNDYDDDYEYDQCHKCHVWHVWHNPPDCVAQAGGMRHCT